MIALLKTHLQNKDDEKAISLLTENSQILSSEDENGSSGLMLIAYGGLEKVLKYAVDLKETLTFHEAIVCGNIEFVVKEATATLVNTHSKDGFSPLSLAAFFNRNDIATILLENGADPNMAATNPSKVTALHSAVAKENYTLCTILIEKGADVNAVQMQNVTALHSAVHNGNLELTQLLVENGADSSQKMDNGDTPLSIATREGHTNFETYLHTKQS